MLTVAVTKSIGGKWVYLANSFNLSLSKNKAETQGSKQPWQWEKQMSQMNSDHEVSLQFMFSDHSNTSLDQLPRNVEDSNLVQVTMAVESSQMQHPCYVQETSFSRNLVH